MDAVPVKRFKQFESHITVVDLTIVIETWVLDNHPQIDIVLCYPCECSKDNNLTWNTFLAGEASVIKSSAGGLIFKTFTWNVIGYSSQWRVLLLLLDIGEFPMMLTWRFEPILSCTRSLCSSIRLKIPSRNVSYTRNLPVCPTAMKSHWWGMFNMIIALVIQ